MCIIELAGHPRQAILRLRCNQGGISLIELIVFIIIVGVALAGVLSVLNLTTARSADPLIRKQMLAIAESLLEEVELQPFTACDPTDANATNPSNVSSPAFTTASCATKIQGFGQPSGPVANRSFFNNVGNYCNEVGTGGTTCTTLSLASPILDMTGTANCPAGYSAKINLVAENLGAITSNNTTLENIKVLRIMVTVSYTGSKEQVVLEGYRTRWMPYL